MKAKNSQIIADFAKFQCYLFTVKISLVKPEKTLLLSEMSKFLCGTKIVFDIFRNFPPSHGSLVVRVAPAKREIAEKQAKISSAAQRKKRTNKGSLREGSLPAFDNDAKK